MSETQAVAGGAVDPNYNPFDSDNFSHGGGLWDGKTITITSAKAKREALKYGDGRPVLDAKTGQQSVQIALYLTGISDGGDDKERHEEYSVGGKLEPTADGEGFVDPSGAAPRFHANSNIGKFSAALKSSGFPVATLIDRNPDGTIRMRFSRLVGARFVMKAEPKLGQDGKPLKDKKGYGKNVHLPVKYVGQATGGAVSAGGAAAGAVASPHNGKASAAVLEALAAAPGNTLTRVDLVRTLAGKFQGAGDPDANAIIGLVVRPEWHTGQAWKTDGVSVSL